MSFSQKILWTRTFLQTLNQIFESTADTLLDVLSTYKLKLEKFSYYASNTTRLGKLPK